MKAWQRLVRERREQEDMDADMFGRWWEQIDTNIAKAVVREIDHKTAEGVILAYEWLGTMPAISRYCFGIYFGDVCGGVVVYGDEYSENLGVWDKYGFTGKMILLSRGACVHWAHQHSASKLIRRSMSMLPSKYEVVTATTDERAGEVGTIYQACGFVSAKMNTHTRTGGIVNGKRVNSRAIRQRLGKSGKDAAESIGLTSEVEAQKIRYFAFRGTAKQRKIHRRAIQSLVIPYPKRGKSQERDGGFRPQGVGRFDDSAPSKEAA